MKSITEKEFTVVGVSCLNGEYKVRYANNIKRGAVLAKNGHTDIILVQLSTSERKEDAVSALLDAVEAGQLSSAQSDAVKIEARSLGFIIE